MLNARLNDRPILQRVISMCSRILDYVKNNALECLVAMEEPIKVGLRCISGRL